MFLRKGACARSDVSDMTAMKRTLGANVFRLVAPSDPSLFGSRLAAFATIFCGKATRDHTAMDLSNMRKKYKEGEDVSRDHI